MEQSLPAGSLRWRTATVAAAVTLFPRFFSTPGSLSAAGKSTVKLANKNVWNRWLSAGEDMPGEINISAPTTRKSSCEEEKAELQSCSTNSAAQSSDFRRRIRAAQTQSGSKVVSPLRWTARPSLRSSQRNVRWFNSLCSSVVFPPPRWSLGIPVFISHDARLWSLISAKSKQAN